MPRPYGFPKGAFYIFQQNSTGSSNYNSLQTSRDQQLPRFHVHRELRVVEVAGQFQRRRRLCGQRGPASGQQSSQQEYGPSNFNVPNRFVWVAGYELPKMGGGWSRLRNGWGTDSTVTLQSGQPFTLNYNFEDDFSGGGDGFDRPDVVGPVVYHKRNPADYLQLSSFAMPCTGPPASPVRGLPRIAFRAPGTTETWAGTRWLVRPTNNGTSRFTRTLPSPNACRCSSASTSSTF